MTGNDVLKNLSEYNIWANKTMLDVFSSLPEIPANAARLFSYALNAQAIWIARITGTESLSAGNMSFYEWDWGFSAQIEVPNSKKLSDIPNNKKIAFAAFYEIVGERLARAQAQIKQNQIESDSGSLSKSKTIVAIRSGRSTRCASRRRSMSFTASRRSRPRAYARPDKTSS